uniref:Uncharacterized protein n=1 Tax=Romanomermis culicivorax TaxID=13658 RepID=A0A915JZC9_ROMCU
MKDCFYDKLMSNKSSEELAECSKRCLNPCMYWKHDFGGVSRMGFNSIGLRDGTTCKTMNDTFERHCLNDIIILDIGYSDLIYTKVSGAGRGSEAQAWARAWAWAQAQDQARAEITQTSSMTFDTFLSNVGGQVGLWMGVSVISIVQILALMLLYFKDKFVGVRNTV